MSEPEAIYEVERVVDPLPCPFCGSSELQENSWYLDDEDSGPFSEVPAIECRQCNGAAPLSAWNTRTSPVLESTEAWHYPQSNLDLDNMPAPGQRVLVFYYDGETNRGPVVSTPIHEDGSHIHEDGRSSIYCPIVRWCAIPE